jgi:hypothetical protein
MCKCFKGNKQKNKGCLRNINVSQAITLFEVFQQKHSYGKLICYRYCDELAKHEDLTRQKLHNDAFVLCGKYRA